jgi:hypothetical protein
MDAGFKVHLANTIAMRQYDGIKYTDDLTDARFLAHLLRLGILPEGYIYPKEERAIRDLLRKRLSLVQAACDTASFIAKPYRPSHRGAIVCSEDKAVELWNNRGQTTVFMDRHN